MVKQRTVGLAVANPVNDNSGGNPAAWAIAVPTVELVQYSHQRAGAVIDQGPNLPP